jgi:hypothetical protein
MHDVDSSMPGSAAPDDDPSAQYWFPVPTQVSIGGHDFAVNVHLALVRGRLACVGIDLRSFLEDADASEGQAQQARLILMNEDWVEITSPVVRGLKTSAVVEKALRQLQDTANVQKAIAGASMSPLEQLKYAVIGSGALVRPDAPRRRGPRPQLDDEVLARVVVPAYRLGGHAPTRAAREALEASGVLKPPVTIDQARKAVAAARKKGLIPPYGQRVKRDGADR